VVHGILPHVLTNIVSGYFDDIAYVSIVSFQKYVCDKCGKQFTEKRSLTHHMKTHVDSSQTYPCNMFLKIKPNDRLILKAVVCCLKIRRTISGKVDAAIS
jgi:uncharacterized Zn-finger protein